MPSSAVPHGERDLAAESMFEYGSRVGFWRLLRLFQERDLPLTVFACALALERNEEVAAAIREGGYDICCHGCRISCTPSEKDSSWQSIACKS